MYYDQVECGMRIGKLRVEIGVTQQQMADRLHISLDYYRALENGRRSASLELLVTIYDHAFPRTAPTRNETRLVLPQ